MVAASPLVCAVPFASRKLSAWRLRMFERHALSGAIARLLREEDPVKKESLEAGLREILASEGA